MEKNELYELEIDSIAEDGSGIGRLDGLVVFCRGMLPGERGVVRILKVTKSYAVGKAVSISTFSPHRVEPPSCPNFARSCGGCTFCHLAAEEQLTWKRRRVSDCLSRIGGLPDAAGNVHLFLGYGFPQAQTGLTQRLVVLGIVRHRAV